jgi:hypothetical protein
VNPKEGNMKNQDVAPEIGMKRVKASIIYRLMLIGLSIPVLMTVFLGSIICFGLWVYSRFRPLRVKVFD